MGLLDAFLSTWSNARSTFGEWAPPCSGGVTVQRMKSEVIERSAAGLTGLAAGYLLWLAGITALTVVVPMSYMFVAAGIFLSVIVIVAFGLAPCSAADLPRARRDEKSLEVCCRASVCGGRASIGCKRGDRELV